MQLPKTVAGVAELHESGGACLSVLAHPTTGGVTASFASLGDCDPRRAGRAHLVCRDPRRRADHAGEAPDDFGLAESTTASATSTQSCRAANCGRRSRVSYALRGKGVTQDAELGPSRPPGPALGVSCCAEQGSPRSSSAFSASSSGCARTRRTKRSALGRARPSREAAVQRSTTSSGSSTTG